MSDSANHQANILFVCYGNICRSPIAEHLARQRKLTTGLIDSAGVNPTIARPTAEAVAVMKEEYGIDISGHRPKGLEEVALEMFDYIVAADPEISDYLRSHAPRLVDRFVDWQIDDPYSLSGNVYRNCAVAISAELTKLAQRLG